MANRPAVSEQRCEVEVHRNYFGALEPCDRPLEPTGGPCADCGEPPHFQGQSDDHPYRPTGGLACLVHGEQGGQR